MNDAKVWLRTRMVRGKKTYDLRWRCPTAHKMMSRNAGTDKRYATHQAAKLEASLFDGTYGHTTKSTWLAFVDDHCDKIPGEVNAAMARRILTDFGKVCDIKEPRRVRYADLERYEAHRRKLGRAVATINKDRRYLHAAFTKAVKRGVAGHNPVDGWTRQPEAEPEKRILKPKEEIILLKSVEELYGSHLDIFVRFLLSTWARLSEATNLEWRDVNFDDGSVYFRATKSRKDRYVPFAPQSGTLNDLRRLQAATLQDGGPFKAFANHDKLWNCWRLVLDHAGIDHLTFHDLRRTGITRGTLRNLPPATIMKLAGHKSLATTMTYYVEISNADLKAAVCRAAFAG